ncbi:MAG: transglutaminase domain-containing protein [Oscillospiraceae bacterium]|nr:transglutaminase domain-containing protein [Oscillospiraceae bacterium]
MVFSLVGCAFNAETGNANQARAAYQAGLGINALLTANSKLSATRRLSISLEADGSGDRLVWSSQADTSYLVSFTHDGSTTAAATVSGKAGDACVYPLDNLDGAYKFVITGSDGSSGTFYYKNGFVMDGERLTYYRSNVQVKNETYRMFTFDEEGYYTSGDIELDIIMESVIFSCLSDGDVSRLTLLRAVYDYIMDYHDYESILFPDITEDGWEIEYAKDFLTSGLGNCFSYAASFCQLAKALGFETRTVYGQVNQTFQWCDHCWNEVRIDGHVFLVDAEMEGVFSRLRDFGWKLFLVEYDDAVTKYDEMPGASKPFEDYGDVDTLAPPESEEPADEAPSEEVWYEDTYEEPDYSDVEITPVPEETDPEPSAEPSDDPSPDDGDSGGDIITDDTATVP